MSSIQPQVTEELFEAAVTAYYSRRFGFRTDDTEFIGLMLDNEIHGEDFRAALAVAYAAGRKAAAQDVQNMSHDLGDEGWEEMCRRAEKAGYDRQVVLRRRRGDFTTTNVEAAYQVGRDFAARVAAGEQS